MEQPSTSLVIEKIQDLLLDTQDVEDFLRCTRDEAMNLIKSASSTRNVKLRDVALAIVESAGGGTLKTHFS